MLRWGWQLLISDINDNVRNSHGCNRCNANTRFKKLLSIIEQLERGLLQRFSKYWIFHPKFLSQLLRPEFIIIGSSNKRFLIIKTSNNRTFVIIIVVQHQAMMIDRGMTSCWTIVTSYQLPKSVPHPPINRSERFDFDDEKEDISPISKQETVKSNTPTCLCVHNKRCHYPWWWEQ